MQLDVRANIFFSAKKFFRLLFFRQRWTGNEGPNWEGTDAAKNGDRKALS
jgi:hypothetical protein